MKTIVQFETAAELFDAAERARPRGDEYPVLPSDVGLSLIRGNVYFFGEGSDRFALSPKVTFDSIVDEAFRRLGLKFVAQ